MITLLKYVKAAAKYLLKRPKCWLNIAVNQLFAFAKISYAPLPPAAVTIEPINVCDHRCPVCETGANLLQRSKGYMKMETFKEIIDKIHTHTAEILLYYMGEPFLNPHIYDMIEYAKRFNIRTEICTNGKSVDPMMLAEADPDGVSFVVGGVTQKIHEIYRKGGDLNRTLENARKAAEEKRKRNGNMKIVLELIVMKHNEHQTAEFLKLAEKLKLDEARLVSPCVRTYEQGLEYLPKNDQWWLYDRKAFENDGVLKPRSRKPCYWIWHSYVVLWNGDVVPCCRDVEGKYTMGNILKQDIKDIWNSKKYRQFRKLVVHEGNVDICQLCGGYEPPALFKM